MVIALRHPLRVEILRLLEEGPNSPNRMSKRLGKDLSNVSYHTRVLLEECDCIELVETRPARGALEHFYRLKPQAAVGSALWKEVPAALRNRYARSSLGSFVERAVEALDAGTVESRQGSGITWLPLRVDQEGWGELVEVLANCEARSQAVAENSAKRMEGTEAGLSVIFALACFEVRRRNGAGPS
jgi:DNA-binding transcriptional ArsR family regulator